MNFFDTIKFFWNNHIRRKLTSTLMLFVVVGLCLISLVYQYFSRSDSVSLAAIAGAVVVPFQKGVNAAGGFLFRAEEKHNDLESARKQIEELEKENEKLKMEADLNRGLVRENEELRSLVRAKERLSEYDMITCSVIGAEASGVFRRFTIDRGSIDGLKVNMNVINGDGLIGYISQVGLNFSVVTCILEDGINVSAMTKNGHDNCIVTGSMELAASGEMVIENALSSVDLDKDSTLVTSFISDKYLPGLLIGYVTENTLNPGKLTRSGKVRCSVDFSHIHEVMVIRTMKEKAEE